MKFSTVLRAVLIALLLPFSVSHAGELRYRTTIDIEQRAGCAYLTIAYLNSGDEIMFFQPDEPVILLMDVRMRQMPFVGIVAKRPPYKLEEHLKLFPGEVLRREIALNKSYGLKEPGRYTISVNVDYFDPAVQKGYEKGNLVKEFRYLGRNKKGC